MPELVSLPPWMMPLLAALAGLLALLVVVQGLLPVLRRPPGAPAARARLSAAVARGSDATQPAAERARAFVEAGREARDALQRPRLAARYAHHAHALAPGQLDVVAFAVSTMRAARRHVGLERALWISMDRAADDATFEAARSALVALYEGPLKRPERARVLAGLRRGPSEGR
jgi:hypothetical protein